MLCQAISIDNFTHLPLVIVHFKSSVKYRIVSAMFLVNHGRFHTLFTSISSHRLNWIFKKNQNSKVCLSCFCLQRRDREAVEENRGAPRLFAREQGQPTQQGNKLNSKKSSSSADTSQERAE